MAGSCDGMVALVTGASRGIGRALATRLASEGADVAITARSATARTLGSSLSDTAEAIESKGRRAMVVEADLADPGLDHAETVAEVEVALGPIDILVNNAAAGGYRPFADWTVEELRSIQQVNVWAPWELCRAVVPGMRARTRGWILNISSSAAIVPKGPPFGGPVALGGSIYGGSKAMLDRFTVSLAAELHGTGVAANALSPQAATATEGVVKSIEAGRIPAELTEPLETMIEAAIVLVTGDPAELTGRVAYSLSLLAERGTPVRDLDGSTLVAGWQPDDIESFFNRGRFPRHG